MFRSEKRLANYDYILDLFDMQRVPPGSDAPCLLTCNIVLGDDVRGSRPPADEAADTFSDMT